jgi:hypothetical protein
MNTGWLQLIKPENLNREVIVGFHKFKIVDISITYIIGEECSGNSIIYYMEEESKKVAGFSYVETFVYNNEEITFSEIDVETYKPNKENLEDIISDFVSNVRKLSNNNVVSFELFINCEEYEVKQTIHTSTPLKSVRNLSGEFVRS